MSLSMTGSQQQYLKLGLTAARSRIGFVSEATTRTAQGQMSRPHGVVCHVS